MQFTPIPNLFLNSLLPQITDIAELKVTLHIFRVIYGKKGYPRFVSFGELLSDRGLSAGLKEDNADIKESLSSALGRAVERGTVLHLVIEQEGAPEDIYLINTEAERRTADKIKNGELAAVGLKAAGSVRYDSGAEEIPNIFSVYEQNIGMITPMIAEELGEAEKLYPEEWIRDAIREAVSLNKRNWRYIARILERWSAEGRENGAYRGDTKKGTDKYAGQKYGHIIKR